MQPLQMPSARDLLNPSQHIADFFDDFEFSELFVLPKVLLIRSETWALEVGEPPCYLLRRNCINLFILIAT